MCSWKLILTLALTATVISKITVNNIESNTIFVKENVVAVTISKFTLLLDVNIAVIKQEHSETQTYIRNMMKLVQEEKGVSRTSEMFKLNFDHLMHVFQKYEVEVESFYKIIPRRTGRRESWFPFMGKIMRVGFGTLSVDDLDQINNDLQGLASNIEQEKTVIKNSILYTKGLEDKIANNSKYMKEVTLTMSRELRAFVSTVNNHAEAIVAQVNALSADLSFANSISQLATLINKNFIDLHAFRQAVELSASNHLSSVLLPPDQFADLLIKIQTNVPYGLAMLAPVTLDHISMYYKAAKVSAFGNENSLILTVTIPLVSPSDVFDEFTVIPIPRFDQSINQFVHLRLPRSLYVSQDRVHYFTSDDGNVHCVGNTVPVCTIDFPVRTLDMDPCVVQAFRGASTSKCQSVVKSVDVGAIITRVREDMLIAVNKVGHSITIKCPNNNNAAPTTEVIHVQGTVLAKAISHCAVTGTGFTMLPKYSIQKLDKVQFKYSEVLYMGNYSTLQAADIQNRLANESLIQELFQSHDWEASPSLSFKKLLADVDAVKSTKKQIIVHSAAGAGISVTMVIVFTLGVVSLLFVLKKCCFKPAEKFILPTNIITHIETPVKTEESV